MKTHRYFVLKTKKVFLILFAVIFLFSSFNFGDSSDKVFASSKKSFKVYDFVGPTNMFGAVDGKYIYLQIGYYNNLKRINIETREVKEFKVNAIRFQLYGDYIYFIDIVSKKSNDHIDPSYDYYVSRIKKNGKGYKRIFKFNDGADPLFTVSNKRIYFTQFDYNKKKNKLVSRVYSISLKGKNKKLEKNVSLSAYDDSTPLKSKYVKLSGNGLAMLSSKIKTNSFTVTDLNTNKSKKYKYKCNSLSYMALDKYIIYNVYTYTTNKKGKTVHNSKVYMMDYDGNNKKLIFSKKTVVNDRSK